MKAIACLLVAGLAMTGCRVETHKTNGDENVKIATPFGGVSVQTGDQTVQTNVGLAVYPGATLVPNDKGDGKNAADVNMTFGNFHLGVKAVSYRTPDGPDKVIAFYRKDLGKFGTVILCNGNAAVGSPDHTPDGLRCDEKGGSVQVHTDESGSVGELKAGSKQHQHLVAVDREGTGTKFGLVVLDLPGHLEVDDDKQ